MAEMERFKREVVDKIMSDEWYIEMVEKDQDVYMGDVLSSDGLSPGNCGPQARKSEGSHV